MSEAFERSEGSSDAGALVRAFQIARDHMGLSPENGEKTKRLSRMLLKVSKAAGDVSPKSLAQAAINQMILNNAPR